MNIMDLWGDYSGNSSFQSWKTAMGWVANVDHIVPASQLGSNSFSNAQVIERSANIAKSAQLIFTDYLKYSTPDKGNSLRLFASIFSGNYYSGVIFSIGGNNKDDN